MKMDAYFLSRITPFPDEGYKDLVRLGGLDPYGQHQALWKLFNVPDKVNRRQTEFLFRAETHGGLPLFYVLSQQIPTDHVGLWHVEPKPYSPDIRKGDRLAFKLRVNPVLIAKSERSELEIETWRDSRKGRGLKEKSVTKKRARHDVVMAAKQETDWKRRVDAERPTLSQLAYEAGKNWLLAKAETSGWVFDVEDEEGLRVDGYRTWRSLGRKGITLSTLDFEGTLSVKDPKRFTEILLGGLGPAKAFGCGLMLVRRV
jgi:CRISPR system Cascade subunit CasE